MNVENLQYKENLKLPKSIFFIISNEFCERFSFYGMRTILTIYLRQKLDFTEKTSTVIYHAFTMLVYFFPLIGAIIADSKLGRYKTIFYLSIVYILGQLVISASAIPALDLLIRELTMIGLLLIAIGTGGIKPCVSAFGGDQFVLPQQARYLAMFFSLFYFAINFGSLFSTFLTPIIRKDVACFGEDTCYSLAFFVPCILMILSLVIFIAGKRLYKIKEPEGNVVANVMKCICHALYRKFKSKKTNREHWLDHADDKYDDKMISDVKATFSVLKLFIPLPFFWALYDQQGSRWTFQAANMNGDISTFRLKPDQMQVVNPLLILIFIPFFETVVYPLLHKIHLNTPLRKLTLGGLLAGFSFVISMFLELQLEKTYPVLPQKGFGQVRIFNTLDCPMNVQLHGESFILQSLNMWEKKDIPVHGNISLNYDVSYTNCKDAPTESRKFSGSFVLNETTATSLVATATNLQAQYLENIDRSKDGEPMVRAILNFESIYFKNLNSSNETMEYVNTRTGNVICTFVVYSNDSAPNVSKRIKLNADTYNLRIANTTINIVSDVVLKLGGVYTIMGHLSKTGVSGNITQVTNPNSLHMFWMLPQYFVMTMAEVMFSVTGLEFAFTQAPESMKSLLQAAWLLTVAFGNFIVVIIAEGGFFDRPVYEFLLFSILMFVDVIIFAIMAKFYKYVTPVEENLTEDLPLSDNISAFNPSFVDSDKRLS